MSNKRACLRSLPSRGEHAEFVAFGIGEDDPRFRVGLTHVDTARSEREEASHLGGLIIGAEIEVQSILHGLRLRIDAEEKSGQLIRGLPDLDLVLVLIDDDPVKCLGPPPSKTQRIVGVDDELFPN